MYGKRIRSVWKRVKFIGVWTLGKGMEIRFEDVWKYVLKTYGNTVQRKMCSSVQMIGFAASVGQSFDGM